MRTKGGRCGFENGGKGGGLSQRREEQGIDPVTGASNGSRSSPARRIAAIEYFRSERYFHHGSGPRKDAFEPCASLTLADPITGRCGLRVLQISTIWSSCDDSRSIPWIIHKNMGKVCRCHI
ncbi:uncharacterized protein BT62DRAFT_613463 [Guyanagaster necrorhizus]|uniref:Uncharacterized protein n=1 Tax=Guyanagaster necrorhizus TaxID=856835 RepID=A0A9P7W0P4_9AGAR|nr:uncharacterized protein BT62DRAFT_613463 [Guyanagaster necrorhizus MCA 3950]KAG7449895.1 hypothetical protein BT62DRAFT_613463 [Guyanagaster necrorhizus MCA 3950]